jgi:hypothetical protein
MSDKPIKTTFIQNQGAPKKTPERVYTLQRPSKRNPPEISETNPKKVK